MEGFFPGKEETMQMFFGTLAVLLALGCIAFAVRRSNGAVRVRTFYAGTSATGDVIHAIMRGELVMYADRNLHYSPAAVVGFTPDGRVKLHVGHAHNRHFTRHLSELRPVSS